MYPESAILEKGGVHLAYKHKWDSLLKEGKVPNYLRSIVRVPYSEFREKILSGSSEFLKQYTESIFGGDLWIVTGVLSTTQVDKMKRGVLAFQSKQPAGPIKVLEDCGNYHALVDGSSAPKGGYVAVDHSSYFFRWNGDEYGLFDMVDDAWSKVKVASGRGPDEYKSNTPKDVMVDRIQVIQYPAGAGKITSHADPHITMKVNLGIYLSTYGKDYQKGGFFIADRPGHPVFIDERVGLGDMVLWFPHLTHGVDTVDAGTKVDWNAPGGRWYLHLNTIESNIIDERHTAMAKPGHD